MRHLITGITGTLGKRVAQKLQFDGHEVSGISRDEQKQRLLPEYIERKICDINDQAHLRRAVSYLSPDNIFHFAALKHIDEMERNPLACVQTNITGTTNVCDVAEDAGVSVVFTSTDKAVNPINVYGHCKAISERIVLERGGVVCRYGNVVGSRGSVIPFFAEKIKNHDAVPITSEKMTRFWINIDDAAKFVVDCSERESGVYIPEIGAAPLITVVGILGEILGVIPFTKVVGLRPGEKLHEELEPGVSSMNRTMSDDDIRSMLERCL